MEKGCWGEHRLRIVASRTLGDGESLLALHSITKSLGNLLCG